MQDEPERWCPEITEVTGPITGYHLDQNIWFLYYFWFISKSPNLKKKKRKEKNIQVVIFSMKCKVCEEDHHNGLFSHKDASSTFIYSSSPHSNLPTMTFFRHIYICSFFVDVYMSNKNPTGFLFLNKYKYKAWASTRGRGVSLNTQTTRSTAE